MPALFSESSRSLVRKHLTEPIFRRLSVLKTASGFTLDKAIRSGVLNPDSTIGVYAGDAESYRVFAPLLDPIIADYHGISTSCRHVSDLSAPNLASLDPEGKYIRSTRIRVARNLTGFNFSPNMDRLQRKDVEKMVRTAIEHLTGEFRGRYVTLGEIEAENLEPLGRWKMAFTKGDRFQEAAGMNMDFPEGRGIFYTLDRRLIIWVNEEDHLRIISLEASADLPGVYRRLGRLLSALSGLMDFARDDRLGYLTACPSNLGTAMRAGVHIRLPKLNERRQDLALLAGTHNLQIRGTRGEKTEVEDGVLDISNARRLGVGESAVIRGLSDGLAAMIRAEERL